MKISNIRVVKVAVPFDKFGEWAPVTMWYGARYASTHSVVFVETDENITGVGCARDTSEDLILNTLRPRMMGLDPFDVEEIARLSMKMRGAAGRRPDASAAIDNALWDIIGKACNKPVYKLLGGKVHEKVRCGFWECTKPPDQQAADCKRAVELGWKSFKIKIGVDPESDVESVRKIREAVGNGIELGFDINAGYSVPTAITTIKKMERYEPACIEQPVAEWDLRGLAEVKRHVDVPIKCHSFYVNDPNSVLRLIELNAADMLNINPDFMGSLLTCKKIASVAEAGGIICSGQSSAAELGPALAGWLHLITSTTAFTGTNETSNHLLEKSGDIITKPFKVVDSCLTVPEGPGLGVEIDQDKLKRWNKAYEDGLYKSKAGLSRADPYYTGMSLHHELRF